MIDLPPRDWPRLYKEASLLAHRLTYSKVPARQWTARDRAQEAVQRACERMLTQRPATVTSFETARDYLFGAIRSSLYNVAEAAALRKEAEQAATTEEETITGGQGASPETMQLAAAVRSREQRRAARLVELTRDELAGDRIALGTMDCIADDKDSPAEQAAILECDVEEVYAARMRRKRAMGRAVARYEREPHPEEETR